MTTIILTNIIMIIGYIHVCKLNNWEKSFDMLYDCLISSKLYENTDIIRIGILKNDDDTIITDERLLDPKFEIVYIGKPKEYERPTLLHMQKSSFTDPSNTKYYYLHTKGIKHFGTKKEKNVIDWINLMLYWNIERWETAIERLKTHPTYGCNVVKNLHYSGNFWWANIDHIKTLPNHIGLRYIDPENWICVKLNNIYSEFNSGFQGMGHYNIVYPRIKYVN
jgi:hypothetical protein